EQRDTVRRQLAEDPDGEPRTRKRLPADDLLRQAELAAYLTHFVFEELSERLDELEVHLLRKTADVVVALDDLGRPFDGDRLDDVRIERALHEEVDALELRRLLLEDFDEPV